MMMTAARYLLARGKEPSTYAAAAALMAMAGYNMDPGLLQAVVGAGVGLSGLAGVLLRDRAAA